MGFLKSVLLIFGFSCGAWAFPTSTLWIPDDTALHPSTWRYDSRIAFTLDKRESDLGPQQPFIDQGLTFGFANNGAIGLEAGIDWWEPEYGDDLKSLHGNLKVVILEEEIGFGVAFGFYNFGFKANGSDEDFIYLGLGKQLGSLSHLFVGYFVGNQNVLLDEAGNSAARGIFGSISAKIGEKVKFVLDYQGGRSHRGALTSGFAFLLSQTSSISLGYVFYNNQSLVRDMMLVKVDLEL